MTTRYADKVRHGFSVTHTRRRALGLLTALAVILSSLIGGSPAAGHYLCQVWPHTPGTLLSLPLWDHVDRSLYPEFGDSVSAWNGSATQAYFPPGASYNYLVNAANSNYGDTGWDGYGGIHGLCGNATDGFAVLNDYSLPPKSPDIHRYVGTHELGHALTLDHADGYVSVMSTTSSAWWTPQQHDLDDMNARYP